MKILFVISSIAIEGGGASKMLVWVANQFVKNGHDVTIYTHKVQNGDLFYTNPNINVISTEPKQKKNLFYPIFHVRKIMKRIRPHIVVSFMSDSNLYCILAKVFTGIPICICERSDPNEVKHQPFKFKISAWMTRFANCAVFQLQQAADLYPWLKVPIKVIPNPVLQPIAKVSKPFMQRKNEICCSSRMSFVQKRQDVLIKAFKIVLESHPEMTLKLIGGGPDFETGKQLSKFLGIEDNVDMVGQKENPIIYMVDSKLFVLPSDYEGIPNALTEAMAAGLPCISTDVRPGGARLLINPNENGIIVPCDNPETMAKAIIYMLDHPDEADKMGQEASNITKRFTENKIYHMWESFLSGVVNKNI